MSLRVLCNARKLTYSRANFSVPCARNQFATGIFNSGIVVYCTPMRREKHEQGKKKCTPRAETMTCVFFHRTSTAATHEAFGLRGTVPWANWLERRAFVSRNATALSCRAHLRGVARLPLYRFLRAGFFFPRATFSRGLRTKKEKKLVPRWRGETLGRGRVYYKNTRGH